MTLEERALKAINDRANGKVFVLPRDSKLSLSVAPPDDEVEDRIEIVIHNFGCGDREGDLKRITVWVNPETREVSTIVSRVGMLKFQAKETY